MLLACKGAGRSQPANSLGSRATPGCLSFPSPLHLQVLSLSGQEPFPGGHEQPMGAVSNTGYLGFLERGGLGGLTALLRAWQKARQAVSPASSACDRPWEYYFPATARSLETWPRWLQSCSCGLSLVTLESRTRDFSSAMQSGGLACDAVC